MLSRKTLETAGFITIAAALHVSAAAIFVGEPKVISLPPGPATGSLSAGGGEIGEMIEKWESPPETSAAPEPAQPEPPQQEMDLPQPQPQAPMPPKASASRPNLPTPPVMEQSEIEEFEPPEIDLEPPLALAASARPERRPAKPQPQPQREVQREPTPQPQRQQQAAPQTQRQAAPSSGQGGGSGGGRAAPAGGGGGSGLSASQKTNLMGQWASQIQSCVAAAVQRAGTSARRGGQVRITATISPSGSLLGAALSASSGDPRADRDASRAVSRVGRCPPAPAGITENQTVVVPITIRPR